MSSTLIRYIPEDPTHVPEPAAAEAARTILEDALGAKAVVRVTPAMTFVDPGDGLEAVRCPACGTELDLPVWREHMSEPSRGGTGGFERLELTLPCCGAETSLHDLDYDRPAGFARFVLEVRDPERDPDEAVDVEALERALGCIVRRIDAHV